MVLSWVSLIYLHAISLENRNISLKIPQVDLRKWYIPADVSIFCRNPNLTPQRVPEIPQN